MKKGGPHLVEILDYRSQDGWRSGIARFSHGKTFQFFVSPSGVTRLYTHRLAKGHLSGMGQRGRAIRRALAEGLATMSRSAA